MRGVFSRVIRNQGVTALVFLLLLKCLNADQEQNAGDKADKGKKDGAIVREEGMSHLPSDSGNTPEPEVLLTPWWDLRFSVGETVSVDCGFQTGDEPHNYDIMWLNSANDVIMPSNRIYLQNNTEAGGKQPSPYTVLSLSIHNLSMEDAGVYTCMVNKSGDGQISHNNSVRLDVLTAQRWCGFEDESVCGWYNDKAPDVPWKREDDMLAREDTHSTGPFYDHTYGPSKHTGHFLDVDVKHNDVTKAGTIVARTYTTLYNTSAAERCLHFWYSIKGRDADQLNVYLKSDDQSSGTGTRLMSLNQTTSDAWTHAMTSVTAQSASFKLGFEAKLCGERCEEGNVAIDDVYVTDGACADGHDTSTGLLRLRLVGGSSPKEGRLEVLHDGQYGTVCNRTFTDKEAKVVCASLNYGTDGARIIQKESWNSVGAPTNQKIWLRSLNCTDMEADFAACLPADTVWGQHADCTHDDDVIISCDEYIQPETQPSVTTSTTATTPSTTTPSTAGTTSTTTPPSTTSKPGPVTPTSSAKPTASRSTMSTRVLTHTSSTPLSTASAATDMKLSAGTSASTPVPLPTKKPSHVDVHRGRKIGRGLVAGIVIIVLIAFAVFAFIVYKGRKRRLRKSKYFNFSGSNYSTEHLPTNEFHLESPLTMSSMGYTVLA